MQSTDCCLEPEQAEPADGEHEISGRYAFSVADFRRAWALTMIDAVLTGNGWDDAVAQPLALLLLLIRVTGQMTLFDCGEGTQIAWRESGWRFRRLGAICISHTHADHIAGLPGLLHAVANAGRTEPIDVFGPEGTGRGRAGAARDRAGSAV